MLSIRRVAGRTIGILSCLVVLCVAGICLRGPKRAPHRNLERGGSEPAHNKTPPLLPNGLPQADQAIGNLLVDSAPSQLAAQRQADSEARPMWGMTSDSEIPSRADEISGDIHGEVRDESGVPVARASIHALDSRESEQTSLTDAAGKFVLHSGGSDEWNVLIEAEGHVPWQGTVRGGEGQADLQVVLSKFGKVLGSVSGGIRKGLSMEVFAEPVNTQGSTTTAPCDHDGHFAIRHVVPGVYRLGIAWAGFRRLTESHVQVLSGQSSEVQLEAPPTGILEVGAVVARNPAFPATAVLTITDVSTDWVTELRVGVGEDGQFRLDDFPVGSYQAELAIPGLARLPAEKFQVSASAMTSVQFTWPAASIEGDVGGGPYGPAPGARLVLRRVVDVRGHTTALETLASEETLADQQGHFEFAGLSKGRYIVVARGEAGQDTGEVDLDHNGSAYLNLWLDSGGPELTIRVVRQGQPALGAKVYLSRLPHGETGGFGITDERGEVKVGPLNRGNYSVEARQIVNDQTLLIAHAEVEIRGSDAVGPLQLELE